MNEITVEEQNELDVMKRILMSEIREQIFPHKIKRHFQLYFGIPQESPEKLQLDQLMLNQDKQITAVKTDYNAKFAKAEQDRKIIRYILIAMAAVFTGANLGEFIRLFGLG